ncbi:MAG: hypothetical protein E5X10_02900 [Mesorhizobium sp.]|nr:hypothetical protein [Mesorhizobium sp. M1A.F.Ca.IN.022.04.1.1]RUV26093.1 hypothetical protein EOA91_05935 [Mesorhizobium sp. M1A.F.Ca.IN.022.04.1.1]TIS17614.1 MAG: hypothetical protein E5X10_02900 [Mesorhizobium sp.]
MAVSQKSAMGVAIAFVALVLPAAAHAPTSPVSCEMLGKLALPNATVTLAEPVGAGAYTGPLSHSPYSMKNHKGMGGVELSHQTTV